MCVEYANEIAEEVVIAGDTDMVVRMAGKNNQASLGGFVLCSCALAGVGLALHLQS